MKIRTDFVTNSSDSSFLVFNIKNKKLFECLTGLGIRFKNVKDGEFSDSMEIVLPSGESEIIEGWENWSLPYVSDYFSISAWLVALILWEVEAMYPPKEEEEYSDFSKELIRLLNDADITHLDWNAVESWSRWDLASDLEDKFGAMDSDIEEATIEHNYGFEGDVGPCIYTEVKDGSRLMVNYGNDEIETEDCDGLTFVVTGKLKFFDNRSEMKEYIEDLGGIVSESISKNTDYLICNNIKSTSSKMKKARSLGIAVLSEAAFIRRFGDPEDFEDLMDEEELGEEAWDLTYDGGVLDFVMENGTQPIIMEVWKDGQWVSGVSDQQAAKEIVTTLLERDDGRLKRLLLLPVADCLTTSDPSLLEKIKNVSIDELCSKGYIRFEIGAVDAYEATDCYLIVRKENSKTIFGDDQITVSFLVICNTKFCGMDGCKIRPIEICSVLNELANGQEFSRIGKLEYCICDPRALSDEYYSCSLYLNTNPYSSGDVTPKNELAQYNVDSKAIIQALLKDGTLKRLLEVDEMSDDDILNAGYIQLWPNLGKTYKAWLTIEWDFSTHQSVSVVPVCRNDSRQTADGGDRLKQISEFVKNTLDNFTLPVRGNVSCDSVSEDIQLGDELTATMITFK